MSRPYNPGSLPVKKELEGISKLLWVEVVVPSTSLLPRGLKAPGQRFSLPVSREGAFSGFFSFGVAQLLPRSSGRQAEAGAGIAAIAHLLSASCAHGLGARSPQNHG